VCVCVCVWVWVNFPALLVCEDFFGGVATKVV
jgi:hypothetical protein